jgi:succinyl-CoA synthetase beta subunit
LRPLVGRAEVAMKIHEYQGKEIFRKYGVAVPRGILATTPDEAEAAARSLGTPITVVKAQIHAGGRGAGQLLSPQILVKKGDKDIPMGGVRLAKTPEDAKREAGHILGNVLKTIQTGPEGQKVRRVYVEEGINIARELYLSMTLDRDTSRITIMASTEGGMDIEKVAHDAPEKILKAAIDPVIGFADYQGRDLAFAMGLSGPSIGKFVAFCKGLYRAYLETDASLVEINPLVVTKDGDLVAGDAKFNFDDNALFRHPDVAAMRDADEEDANEAKAHEFDLAYITLDGNIGCMVNGAGLAMATMDTIKLVGGQPANFLDVGGGATKEKVTAAFKLILSDSKVKAVLVNIFGGIMKCDVIAEGIIAAAKEVKLTIPLIVRLEGTNVEQGKALLRNSGLAITPADNLRQAAEKAVAAIK